MCRPTFVSGKDVVLDIGFYVTKGITELKAKGVYAEALIKKRGWWLKGILGELIETYFENNKVDDVGMIEAITEYNKLFKIFFIKNPDCVIKIMVS